MQERDAHGGAPALSFGERLWRHRIDAGLTQQELAERAGLSVRGLSDLERGIRRAPYPDTVERLVEALALSAAERATLTSSRRSGARATTQAWATAHSDRAPVGEARLGEASAAAATPRLDNLPAHLPNLIGREEALATVRERLQQADSGAAHAHRCRRQRQDQTGARRRHTTAGSDELPGRRLAGGPGAAW
jgi:transcriptional regulator with XRE-family HTH domain